MDNLSPKRRSAVMRSIRSSGTTPEQHVAVLLRRLRYSFASNRRDLPGSPDFVLTHHPVAIFVHGCFWHRHGCQRGQSLPSTRRKFWSIKLAANALRDKRNLCALIELGYAVIILWECGLPESIELRQSIRDSIAAIRRFGPWRK